jgi:hypothetical protein
MRYRGTLAKGESSLITIRLHVVAALFRLLCVKCFILLRRSTVLSLPFHSAVSVVRDKVAFGAIPLALITFVPKPEIQVNLRRFLETAFNNSPCGSPSAFAAIFLVHLPYCSKRRTRYPFLYYYVYPATYRH